MDIFNKKKLLRLTEERDSLLQKYSAIISIENEVQNLNAKIAEINKEREKLSSEYKEAKKYLMNYL